MDNVVEFVLESASSSLPPARAMSPLNWWDGGVGAHTQPFSLHPARGVSLVSLVYILVLVCILVLTIVGC